MILVTVFLSILNQLEIHLVQNWKKNCHHDHIRFNLKGNRILVFSVWRGKDIVPFTVRSPIKRYWRWRFPIKQPTLIPSPVSRFQFSAETTTMRCIALRENGVCWHHAGGPPETPRTITAPSYYGVERGPLNWAPILPREARLSGSEYIIFW